MNKYEVISEGIASGYAHVVSLGINNEDDTINQKQLFEKCLAKALEQLNDMNDTSGFIDEYVSFQKLMIADYLFKNKCIDYIEKGFSAVQGIHFSIEYFIKELSKSKDNYLRERISDLKDVESRLISIIRDVKINLNKYVLFSDNILPSFIIQNKEHILGVVTRNGGYNSHGAIICRQYNIPYIVSDVCVNCNDYVIIDTYEKLLIVNPTKEDIEKYKFFNVDNEEKCLIEHSNLEILANVNDNFELNSILSKGFDGIGLYRTEMVFMNSDHLLSMEEQIVIYSEAIEGMKDKPLYFRTYDIGDDKKISYLNSSKKGIENYLNNPILFENQIKAILKSSFNNNVNIMFPMIYTIEDFNYLKNKVLKIKEQLDIGYKIKIGMMLETKQALLNISDFIEVDFISVGTNDLVFDAYGINRDEQIKLLNYYLDDLLNDLKKVIVHCKRHSIKLSLCGELASVEEALLQFINLGINSFSVSVSSIKKVNKCLKKYKI